MGFRVVRVSSAIGVVRTRLRLLMASRIFRGVWVAGIIRDISSFRRPWQRVGWVSEAFFPSLRPPQDSWAIGFWVKGEGFRV